MIKMVKNDNNTIARLDSMAFERFHEYELDLKRYFLEIK
jgi:hypothetical protein